MSGGLSSVYIIISFMNVVIKLKPGLGGQGRSIYQCVINPFKLDDQAIPQDIAPTMHSTCCYIKLKSHLSDILSKIGGFTMG